MQESVISFADLHPDAPFVPHTSISQFDEAHTPNGNYLHVTQSDREVTLYDPRVRDAHDMPIYFFLAQRPTAGATAITLSIRNRDVERGDLRPHPDIRPRALLPYVLGHFARTGSVIQAIDARWDDDPTMCYNWDQYHQGLVTYAALPETERRVRAARETWTGRLVAGCGFTRVAGMYEGDGAVVVRFAQPAAV